MKNANDVTAATSSRARQRAADAAKPDTPKARTPHSAAEIQPETALSALAKPTRRSGEQGRSSAVEHRPIPARAPRTSPTEIGGLRNRFGFQTKIQAPLFGSDSHAVRDHYKQGKEIQPIGDRIPMARVPRTGPSEADRAARAITGGREFSAEQLQGLEQAVARKFPDLAADGQRLHVAALALASVNDAGDAGRLFDGMSAIDFPRLAEGRLEAVGRGARTPVTRAVDVLMTLSRSGPYGAGIAAAMAHASRPGPTAPPSPDAAALATMAAGPLEIERCPATITAIHAALARKLDGLAPPPAAARVLTEGERQITAFAIHEACGGDVEMARKVVDGLMSCDLAASLASDHEATEVDVAVQKTLRKMTLAGGAAVLAARKMNGAAGGGALASLSDLRSMCAAWEKLAGGRVETLQQAVAEAARIQAALAARPAPGSEGTELPALGERAPAADVESRAASRRGLGDAWPSPQALRDRGVASADVDKRLPALALAGMARKLAGETPTLPQKAAMGAVRNGILDEKGKLEFADGQCRQLGQWLKPGAGANALNRLLGNRLADDPIAPLVAHGPLGSLNNVAVPQLGMKESLRPLTALMTMIATQPQPEGAAPRSPAQQQLDFGMVALLQHWSTQTQGMLGKNVVLRPEQRRAIGAEAARLAGKTGDEAAGFSKAVEDQLEGVTLDQDHIRTMYENVVRLSVELQSGSSPEDAKTIEGRLEELDRAMIRATGAPGDFDNHYAAEVPAYGSGAMRPGADAARDKDRIGALSGVMEKFGASSGLNMTSYGGAFMPDQGTVITTAMRMARHPFFSGLVSPNFVFGYQHGRTAESIVRMGVNASGIEFNFGKGHTTTNGFAYGVGAGINAYEIAGRKQRVGLLGEGAVSGSHSSWQSVFLRAPRNSEAEGGVKGAAAGAASDSVRTEYVANAMRRLDELVESGDANPMLSLMAEFDVLSVGIADGENDFTDTTRYERSKKGTLSAGIGSVGGEKWNLPGSAALSGTRSVVPDRTLSFRTYGSTDVERTQQFTQTKTQAGVSAQFPGRPTPASASAAYVPQGGNYPTSMAFTKTTIDGVLSPTGTYWVFETESRDDWRAHYDKQAGAYAADLVSFKKDLKVIRDAKLEQFRQAAVDRGHPPSDAELQAHAQELLDDDIHAHMEELEAMVGNRTLVQGMSYRSMAETTPETHEKANELMAIAELARQSPHTAGLAQAKDEELQALLGDPESYVRVDVGFRINTYQKSELNLAGVAYSGWKMDARTNADRAKI